MSYHLDSPNEIDRVDLTKFHRITSGYHVPISIRAIPSK